MFTISPVLLEFDSGNQCMYVTNCLLELAA